MADGVDAPMQVVQSRRHPQPLDVIAREAELQQLPPRHNAVLAIRQHREHPLAAFR